MGNKRIQTNWYVITGGPCTGKTTLINLLAERGYKTTIEHARHYIDIQREKGETVEEIRENKRKFQLGVLDMQILQEAELKAEDTVFLDRALPDAMAYYRFLNLDFDAKLLQVLEKACYKKVFILNRLPLIQDYARREDEAEQIRIHNLIIETYESRSCPVIHVPVLPPEERVDFVLKNI